MARGWSRHARMSGIRALPLRSAQIVGQQHTLKKRTHTKRFDSQWDMTCKTMSSGPAHLVLAKGSFVFGMRSVCQGEIAKSLW